LFLAVIFGAFIYHFGKMLFGNLPRGMSKIGEPLSGKLAFIFIFVQISALWVMMPFIKKDLIWIARSLFQG